MKDQIDDLKNEVRTDLDHLKLELNFLKERFRDREDISHAYKELVLEWKKKYEDLKASDNWIDLEEKLPKVGEKVKMLRKMEFEGFWNGEEVIKGNQSDTFKFQYKTFWKVCE